MVDITGTLGGRYNRYVCYSFRTLGTPDEQTWSGVTELPMYQPTFPKWPKQKLTNIVKKLPEEGINLLEVMHILIVASMGV